MEIDLEHQKLPKIYKRNGRDCYLDPIRQKLIMVTPEETVRQQVISYLISDLQVPRELITVEDRLSHYNLPTNLRADIIVNRLNEDGTISPLAVVECKAPNVGLGEKEEEQTLRYCEQLGCEYAMLINGHEYGCTRYSAETDQYQPIEGLPTYSQMLNGKYITLDIGELPPRIPFDRLQSELQASFSELQDIHEAAYISPLTKQEIALPAFNLLEGLLDTRKKMPAGDYGIFYLLQDYGVRMMTYGNASGGQFFGPYRSFLIEYKGSTEFVSMTISTYFKSTNQDNIKTCLSVAIDSEKESHHALQLVLDDNLDVAGNKCTFYHSGRIAVGHLGSGKISGLRELIQAQYPRLVHGKIFLLGSLENTKLWSLDDPDVIKLVANLIAYALLRDEYRTQVKNHKC